MRARPGDEQESATVTAARQLADEARESWRAPRPQLRARPAPRAVGAQTPTRFRPELPARPAPLGE